MNDVNQAARSAEAGSALLTPAELHAGYRIPIATAAKWRWNGSGPCYVKLGSRVYYRKSDVEAWIADNTHSGTSATL